MKTNKEVESLQGIETFGKALLLSALLICANAVEPVTLQASDYNVQHNFRLRPRGNMIPKVQAVYYAHAWVETRRPDCTDSEVVPALQPVGWGDLGMDRLGTRGRVLHRDRGAGTVEANLGRLNVGAGGLPRTTWTARAHGCVGARAIANAQISVNALTAGGDVTGVIRTFGSARASAPPPRRSRAYAFSMAMVEARGGREMRNGRIVWRKVVRDTVAGRSSDRRQVDPIDYTVRDLVTGEVHEGTLYTVDVDILNSPDGGFEWDEDVATVWASNLSFLVEFPSDKTSLKGRLWIKVEDGKVVESEGTGFFENLNASLGEEVPFKMDLPNEIEFDYDLGDFEDHDLEVDLDMYGAGETEEEAEAEVPGLIMRPVVVDTPARQLEVSFYPDEEPWMVQVSPRLGGEADWQDLPMQPMVLDDGRHSMLLPMTASDGFPSQFFRLRRVETPQSDFQITQLDPQCGDPVILVEFNRPLDFETLFESARFMIQSQHGEALQVISMDGLEENALILILDQPPIPGVSYHLQATGVLDMNGQPLMPQPALTFGCPPSNDTAH